MDEVSSRTLLEGVCRRRHHVVVRVVESEGSVTLMIEAPRYGSGPWPESTPGRFPLTRGSGHRYRCACGGSGLVRDDRLMESVDAGVRKIIVC